MGLESPLASSGLILLPTGNSRQISTTRSLCPTHGSSKCQGRNIGDPPCWLVADQISENDLHANTRGLREPGNLGMPRSGRARVASTMTVGWAHCSGWDRGMLQEPYAERCTSNMISFLIVFWSWSLPLCCSSVSVNAYMSGEKCCRAESPGRVVTDASAASSSDTP